MCENSGFGPLAALSFRPNELNAQADGSAREQRNCQSRALRGGSFRNDRELITSSARNHYDASVRYIAHGFRVARTLN
jgi:formylglycine-generating enzyme required for sulfatase activity